MQPNRPRAALCLERGIHSTWLDMVQALLGSFGAWKPGGRFHGSTWAGVETSLGILGFLQRCSCAPLCPEGLHALPEPSSSHSMVALVHWCGADCAVVNFGMVYGTAYAVMRFQRSRREALFRLPQFHLTLHASRNSASA
jgi:hypothetical protein